MKSRSPRRLVALVAGGAVAASLGACALRAPTLEPAPSATRAEGRGLGAVAAQAGVRVTARVGAWAGVPSRLTRVEPVLVTVENGSEVPLRVRYDDFSLRSEADGRLAALPPFDVDGTAFEPVAGAGHAGIHGFHVARHHAGVYRHLPSWRGHWYDARHYHHDWWPVMQRLELPTGDMVQKALPEGVVEPGGRVTGFLYFQPPSGEASEITFRHDLVDARDGGELGTVELPFVLRRGR